MPTHCPAGLSARLCRQRCVCGRGRRCQDQQRSECLQVGRRAMPPHKAAHVRSMAEADKRPHAAESATRCFTFIMPALRFFDGGISTNGLDVETDE